MLYHIFNVIVIIIFLKDTKFMNHISGRFDFRCCFSFSENDRSAIRRLTGYCLFSTVPEMFFSTSNINAPEKLTVVRPFWCL